MLKIIIKHLVGSKANQTEFFEMPIQEISFGRDSVCEVVFDPVIDDLVSRLHCKISVQNDEEFLLTDSSSRNGTFLNNSRLQAPQILQAGDVVQLGKGGAEFVFDLDPRPTGNDRTTRLGNLPADFDLSRETRIDINAEQFFPNPFEVSEEPVFSSQPSGTIGRKTVERLIDQAETHSRKKLINIGAGLIAVILAVSGYFIYKSDQEKAEIQETLDATQLSQKRKLAELMANKALSSADIFKKYGNSTVFIEASWKLIDIPTGKQFFQRAICVSKHKGKCQEKRPAYRFVNGAVEPDLTLEAGYPVGGEFAGSGFVVNENGYILTNRHVAAGWQTQNRHFELPGALKICQNEGCEKYDLVTLPDDPNNKYVISLNNWIPSKSIYKSLHGKSVEGRNDYLDVTFPKTGLRIPAHLVRVSDSADVALIKIDTPQRLESVDMSANDLVSAGETITVMGYPGVSPDIAVKMDSKDPLNREGEWRQIPDPTVTGGNIGKVIEGSAKTVSDSVNGYFSEMGDVYQLTVNATGNGNSGGPVFNDKGHVIGIFSYGKTDQSGTDISFAVPIKHGQEIMGIHKLVQ